MNPSLPIGHRDPRTEMVPSKYLHLAAQLITDAKPDLDYWNNVKVPLAPSDRLPFEELRQVAVFLPLLLVVLAFLLFRFIGAAVVFACILPLMKVLHDSMQKAILNKRDTWRRRDAGRYAFTQFMCKEFDLKPEDVTMKLVLKMSADFRLWLETATRLRLQDEEAERQRRTVQAVTVGSGTDSAPGQARNTLAARGATVGILDDVAQKLENEEVWSINPATGLPMVSSAMDIHGNMFGMDNMDSLFNNSNYSNSFNTNFESGIGSQPGGFDSGGSSYGGYGFD